MKTSVVISTYNGEKYILEQLESINGQTRLPDEVLIKDDCSTDDTVGIVKEYIQNNHLENHWKLIVNDKNLGWRKNFIELLKLATGDLIFLCDQDDIWMPDKISKMEKVFEDNSQVLLLASDVQPFYENSKPRKIYQTKLGNELLNKIEFDKHGFNIGRPGCSYCIKHELTEFIDKIWFEEWAHDSFLWILAMCLDGLYSYKEELIRYRRHNLNNSPNNDKKRSVKIGALEYGIKTINRLLENRELLHLKENKIKELTKMKIFWSKRLEALYDKSVAKMLYLVIYINYYPRKRSWIADIISIFR